MSLYLQGKEIIIFIFTMMLKCSIIFCNRRTGFNKLKSGDNLNIKDRREELKNLTLKMNVSNSGIIYQLLNSKSIDGLFKNITEEKTYIEGKSLIDQISFLLDFFRECLAYLLQNLHLKFCVF